MKRIIAFILALCSLAVFFSACGQGKEGDNNSSVVEITLPKQLFEGEENFDADAYAKEQGYDKVVVNDDGSVTITMTQAKYDKMLSEVSADIEKSFSEMVGGENTPYIKEITHNDDFSSVTVKVDRAAYESAFDLTPLTIGITTYFYQMLLEMENHCEINIVDAGTGDIIKTTVYPDALNG